MKKDNMQKKLIVLIATLLLINIGLISAHSEETFLQAEKIIKQKIPCENLTQEQLEILGDYYMEQMHPGELHETLDERMGGEGSESLRQVHINMGLAFYCGERGAMPSGMMNMMMGRSGYGNMMYGGMMGNYYSNGRNNTNNIFIWLFNIFLIIGLVLLIIWLIKQIQSKKKR